MAEDPIKLFSTRAERYPEPTEADVSLGAGRAALAAIPFVGGSITEVLSLVLAPAVARRRDTWFKEIADGLDQLEEKVEGFKIEDLQHNEAFVSGVIQATRVAVGTHQQEKLKALRNAVFNTALDKTLDEDKQTVFWNLVEALTGTHFIILRLFTDRAAFVHERRLELIQRRQMTDPMVIELSSRGLLNDPRPYVARSRESDQSLIISEWTLTPFGKDFMAFVSTPEPLK